ncbi:MAG: hypothetical protein CSA96_00210 [Bacteroidetes bacterium]|nr:MAG: hypothetical protein CSA96_00210 [Bacteroidota bacterium]
MSSRVLEMVWFIIGGLLLYMAVDVSMSNGLAGSWYYYLFALTAFLMYFFKRKHRHSRRD